MLQSKIFANGSTTLPKPVRDALGIKAGDRVRYVISGDRVQVLRTRSVHELAGMLARDEQAAITQLVWKMPSLRARLRVGNDPKGPVSYDP